MSTTKPAIAAMLHPTVPDFRRAVVTQTHFAREMLSLSERSADRENPKSRVALLYAKTSLHTLRAALHMVGESGDDDPAFATDIARMEILLKRAIHACEAAIGHIERYQAYEDDHETKLERDMLNKQLPIWRRSAEEAKKEAHRALVLMCERWPDSYEKEDIGV